MLIGIDVDGVIANLHQTWLDRYNQDYNDTVRLEQLHNWDAEKWPIKPECGKKIYDYLRQGDLYQEVQPFPGALYFVQSLKKQVHRVVYVTSNAKGMTDQKWEWLEREGFLPTGRYTAEDLVVAHDKRLVKTDVLIDDKLATVVRHPYPTILMDQPWNRDRNWSTRAYSWNEALTMLNSGWYGYKDTVDGSVL